MSGFDWEDGRDYERAEDANARADRDDDLRHWEAERQDALTRDRGESGNPAYATWTERVKDAGYEAHDPKGRAVA